MKLLNNAKVYIEANKRTRDPTPREKAVAISQVTWKLTFKDPEDEQKYLKSLKNLFFFPTFWPIILVFVAFTLSQSVNVVRELKHRDVFLAASFAVNMGNILIIFTYTISQLVDYFSVCIPRSICALAKVILNNRLEDVIIVLSSLAQGIYQLSLVSRDLCTGCGTMFAVEECSAANERAFPINQSFFAFVSLIMLPIYFKSISRHMVLLSWFILTVFIIATYVYGGYKMDGAVVLFIIFFLVSICEFERYKMISYLLSKEALSYEQNKLYLMAEKSKVIERKLHLALVHQILPPKVAEQIIAGKQVVPETFQEVTIFFSDVVGFTNICSAVPPEKVVKMLNDLYTVMDYCTSLFPLYKVETIGDAYMLVGGLPTADKDHALHIANFALLVQRAVQAVKSPADGSSINIRIGLHSGPVMAGVVGNLMPRYCLFGDTVNTASRMESNGIAGRIHCSATTSDLLSASGLFDIALRGAIDVKGKGTMTTYWLEGAKERNEKANGLAIERTQNMVQELLDAEKDHSEGSGDEFDDIPLIGDVQMEEEGSALGSISSPRLSVGGHRRSSASRSPASSAHSVGSLHQSPAKSRPSLRYAHDRASGTVMDSTGAKILVVEDVELQRKLMVRKLQKADPSWDVSTAVSGEDALQKLKAAKLHFDVVFVDENLSTNDGLFGHELVQVMRESFKMDSTVIIACTGNPKKSSEELMDAGVDYVMSKPPPSPEEIKSKIDVLLNARLRHGQTPDDKHSAT